MSDHGTRTVTVSCGRAQLARSTYLMESLCAVKGDPLPPTVQVVERDVDVAIIGML